MSAADDHALDAAEATANALASTPSSMAPEAATEGQEIGESSTDVCITSSYSGPNEEEVGTIHGMAEPQVFYYGDNLNVMREWIGDESVDLIYLDPPFNSKRIYNRFFRENDGTESDAQLSAFDDYWRWGPESDRAFEEVVLPKQRRHVPATLSDTMQSLRRVLGESDIMAYLAMMAVRLVEMRRVLKQTGSLYLHCDPTVSHYVKFVLDALFGPENFRNEIIWKRTGAHNSAHGFGPIHDTILYYSRSVDTPACNIAFHDYSAKYLKKFRKIDPLTNKRFQDVTLSGSGTRNGESGKPWRGHNPTAKNRHWAIAASVYKNYLAQTGKNLRQFPFLERLDRIDGEGLLFWPEDDHGGLPRYKFFREDAEGVSLQDMWTDIPPINSQAKDERTGYPTQKPIALLARIIAASSKPGDLILDPFCGCGTTVEAAQQLGRQWIGIDITHVAVSVLRRRLEGKFNNLVYKIRGEPEDYESARALALSKPKGRFEFQAWIVDKIGGLPVDRPKEKGVANSGGDDGVDGWVLFRDDPKALRSKRIVLSVKSNETPHPEMIRELIGTINQKKATAGALLLLEDPSDGVRKKAVAAERYSSDTFAPDERFDKIQVLTVKEIFEGKRLKFPGWNSGSKSVPPGGTSEATLDLFESKVDGLPERGAAIEEIELWELVDDEDVLREFDKVRAALVIGGTIVRASDWLKDLEDEDDE